MEQVVVLLQLLISGILVGSVYSLVAMGFVVTFRTAQVFNLAYGQFAVMGAFIAWSFIGSPDNPRLPLPVAAVLTLVAAVVLGLVVERIFFRRMVGRPVFASFILSLGLLALMYGITMLVWGPSARALATTVPKGPAYIGELVLPKEYIWSFVLAAVATIAFVYFFRRTRLGLAMRAAYDHQVAARCLGVNAKLNSRIAWALCAVIATIGGVLIGAVNGVSFALSDMVLVVLAVVLIGGIDSLVGCVLGGLILAIGSNLASYYLSSHLAGIDAVFSMFLILAVLLIRPHGLAGVKPVERV